MKRVLVLLLAMGVVASLVGFGSYALFSDVEKSVGNTFTVGTLDMQLSNEPGTPGQPGQSESVTGTWVSPTNWAPGDYFEAALHVNNKGSVDARHIYFMFSNIQYGGSPGAGDLRDAIIMTIKERFNTVTTEDQAPYLEQQLKDLGYANGDGILTLKEFLSFLPNQYAYFTVDDRSGDGIVIGASNLWDYDLIFGFKFDEDAGNEYQGTWCQFDVTLQARQLSPIEGMICLHQQV